MKKAVSILALALLSIGLFSCEAENNVDETQALYELDTNATDGEITEDAERESGND
ncbi:hypothetical protein [Costertonia aggregata]|uniref:Secreted protein n=1 Tax=Costertonia aggregata TaxID=343403 RepID=A0A7H9AJJ5_9FLAO|nr:hypothetical protein [Costertonia aggregata]QLG43819.1 hypothetical protein HYG79_00120 [Costertonia aggregata]